jgi:uncharacterized cupin superfamily protein
VPEAQLEDSGSGLAPVTDGWFAVNVRDAEWWISERRGAACNFESEERRPPLEFEQVGINVTVLEPGQSNGYYHSESDQEAFLVLSGECRLLVEGEERRLRQWDFFHCPPWTEHSFVGAGDGPCVILMAGTRSSTKVRYPVSELAASLRSERRGGDRLETGVREVRAVTSRAALVLGSPPLGLAPSTALHRIAAR